MDVGLDRGADKIKHGRERVDLPHQLPDLCSGTYAGMHIPIDRGEYERDANEFF